MSIRVTVTYCHVLVTRHGVWIGNLLNTYKVQLIAALSLIHTL
jgi:hypothetical protein